MKSSPASLIKRHRPSDFPDSLIFSRKRHRPFVANAAYVHINILGLPLISSVCGSSLGFIRLEPFRIYTIGRGQWTCEFVFEDRRVSKRHCQIRFDAVNRKVWIGDGMCLSDSSGTSSRVSLNGLFVNGVKLARGEAVELRDGSEVSLVCRNVDTCGSEIRPRIGFVVQRIVYKEEVINEDKQKLGIDKLFNSGLDWNVTVKRANSLLYTCRQVLESTDPVSCIQKCIMPSNYDSSSKNIVIPDAEFPVGLDLRSVQEKARWLKNSHVDTELQNSNAVDMVAEYSQNKHVDILGAKPVIDVDANGIKDLHSSPVIMECDPPPCAVVYVDSQDDPIPPPGSKFYLNRLKGISQGTSDHHHVVSLPELLHPLESLSQVFIATFTCDIRWFLSYCQISSFLPVTIACHDRRKCWSLSPNERILVPYSDYPNVTVVYPPFPESIAFGMDHTKLGIACHHPKLLVLQREDCIRVVITSANLVPKQWNNVTNTVWWQDFPRRSTPDYAALFVDSSDTGQDPKSDFSAQLAGFIASLIVGIPSVAHWVVELTKYEFKEATGCLVTSVPGVHSQKPLPITSSKYHLPDGYSATGFHKVKVLGSIDTMVAGLGHLFKSKADSTGAKLKKLALFVGRCNGNENGMLEVILRRNTNIKADANAVSVFVPDSEDICGLDGVQIGFLPRDVAKWVAPLSDSSLFQFSGFICPKEVLATALGGSTSRVQLILYVSQGSAFSNITKIVESRHIFAISSMVASVKRCTGIWRLQEVLSQYKWPEELETDFFFGSSSVGSVNAQFLAAFSAAAGKTTPNICESEESDPDWGCWSASQELINPSIRILFPTIERVRSQSAGILASKCMLCFSEKTWQRLKNVNILHDAVPCPIDRVGHPMHVKIARRRFQSKRGGVPFGWVYCGSHNFSAAAWGRPLSNPNGIKLLNRPAKTNSVMGSRLHISNYELGIIFIVPPPNNIMLPFVKEEKSRASLDDIMLPFATPAPKYRGSDRPATARAMREAWINHQLSMPEKELVVVDDSEEEEVPDEEDEVTEQQPNGIENEDHDKAYAEVLWCQVDDSS